MKTQMFTRLSAIVALVSLPTQVIYAQADSAAYLVKHPYTTQLNAKEVVRGSWSYQLDATAVSRSGGRVHKKDSGTVGPFEADTSETRTITANSGSLATATPNASFDFSQTSGSHQVDGTASVGGDGRYARAYSKSSLAINTGVKRANGKIRWSPNWRVDRISGTGRAGRDPVDLVFQNRETGEVRDARLFDLQFALGAGGGGGWEDGRFTLRGIDGMFALSMDSPYLTSPTGNILLEFDLAGIVTRSEATGVFAGQMPAVGQAAIVDLDVNPLLGSTDGYIDLDYDLGMEGDLSLAADFSSDGMVQAAGGDGPLTVNDFSQLTHGETLHPLMGTTFASNQAIRTADLYVPTPDEDAYAGYADLAVRGPQRVSTLTFDSTDPTAAVRGVSAQFDVRIQDHDRHNPTDGMALLLLPTEGYGPEGAVGESQLSADFSSLFPAAAGALGVGIDVIGEGPSAAAQVSLAWDQQPLGQTLIPLQLLGDELLDWQQIRVDVQPAGDMSRVTVALMSGTEGVAIPVLQQLIPQLSFSQGVRPMFATTGRGNQGLRGLDNVYIDYLIDAAVQLLGDLDGNQTLDVNDLQSLFASLQTTDADSHFDLNQDGIVNAGDVETWVHDIKQTWFGDANLDGYFDSGDMITVFQAGRFEQEMPASWTEGDWSGDGRFDTTDLVVAFQDGGYEMGSHGAVSAVAAVPEPTSCSSLLLAVFGLAARRRTRAAR